MRCPASTWSCVFVIATTCPSTCSRRPAATTTNSMPTRLSPPSRWIGSEREDGSGSPPRMLSTTIFSGHGLSSPTAICARPMMATTTMRPRSGCLYGKGHERRVIEGAPPRRNSQRPLSRTGDGGDLMGVAVYHVDRRHRSIPARYVEPAVGATRQARGAGESSGRAQGRDYAVGLHDTNAPGEILADIQRQLMTLADQCEARRPAQACRCGGPPAAAAVRPAASGERSDDGGLGIYDAQAVVAGVGGIGGGVWCVCDVGRLVEMCPGFRPAVADRVSFRGTVARDRFDQPGGLV